MDLKYQIKCLLSGFYALTVQLKFMFIFIKASNVKARWQIYFF